MPANPATPLAVIVLAAGAGTRMKSATPKPLHTVAGAPMLAHAMASAGALAPAHFVVVVGHGGAAVAAAARAFAPGTAIVEQTPQRGTGDAARRALAALPDFDGTALVLYADTPLLRPETLEAMVAAVAGGAAVAALGFERADPGAYGRLILTPEGDLARIVEAADATPAERAVTLCNAGVMAFDAKPGRRWLAALTNDNAKGEHYLTDLVAAAVADGRRCAVARCDEAETLGVNDRIDLAAVEAAFQRRARAAAMREGATLLAPETVFLAFDTRLGRDVVVGPHVVFGPGVTVEDRATIGAFSALEGCTIRAGAAVGPFARLRPGADVGAEARIGNFVEVKNAVFGPGAKANHLAYVGDASVGAGANIGAGVITCNYDGTAKHRTVIGEGAFIGSNAALVAPVSIGDGAYVASGSVITADVAPDALALARGRQVVKPGLAARLRARLAAMKQMRRE
ncbi:MAG: bifunctional UDP-N-acetylglucosamine diphosphorylase/glucosamine-1-phosphate N-acetyltransferase GlmU [Rhodobacteraceae bacterium]|nr:MAG: bifunctional UDP-N-acetylglucosamine diphosphorylase/glucosamine-1-phosphate N-acetyltransferase GlmU [Paracoccaceae bacterium]